MKIPWTKAEYKLCVYIYIYIYIKILRTNIGRIQISGENIEHTYKCRQKEYNNISQTQSTQNDPRPTQSTQNW
jgi:hypothetical protein